MLLPSIFGEDLFDDFFRDDFFKPLPPVKHVKTHELMKTDIRELENTYELSVELPGVKKEDVKAELKDGYLTVSAETVSESKENSKYVRCERYVGKMQRSFFVGDGLTDKDIKARFRDGILYIDLPKEQPEKIEERKFISIE
ncbi:MAG: Hsp20/alpha crystallin family protein [Clostridia bacterium]|nr:Hsp20/alpha crystallin family protein [Clostridia bacterium]